MKKKRLFLIAGLLAAIVCVGLVLLAFSTPRTAVTKPNFDRIKRGMTKAEITDLFENRPPDITTFYKRANSPVEWWETPNGGIAIYYDEEHLIVTGKEWRGYETVLEKIRRWSP